MITSQHLNNLVAQSDKIKSLLERFQLDDIVLAQPLVFQKEKLHFLVLRGDQILPADVCADIYIAIQDLLEMGFEDEDIGVSSKVAFRSGYLKEQYGKMLSFRETTSPQEMVYFIEENLGFKYAVEAAAVSVPALPQDSQHDVLIRSSAGYDG